MQQRLERTEPDHVVDDYCRKRLLLLLVGQNAAQIGDFGDELLYPDRQRRRRHAHDHPRLDPREDLVVDLVGRRRRRRPGDTGRSREGDDRCGSRRRH
jgi:hypothetical protein